MSHVFVVKPGEQSRLSAVADEAKRLQAKVLAVGASGDKSKCRICASQPANTKEHVPPKKAFNRHTVLLRKIDETRSGACVRWRNEQRQGGHFEYSLCKKCNNDTGGWYGREYVGFVKACADHAVVSNAGKVITLELKDIYPARIVKQALTMICSSSGPGLTHESPELRKFLLNKDEKGLPDYLKLHMYLRCHGGGRSSGIAGIMNTNTGSSSVVSEVSWWPVGWILAFDDSQGIVEYDVSEWYKYGYDERRSITIKLPCRFAVTAYPMDFRNPDQVLKERNERLRQQDGPA